MIRSVQFPMLVESENVYRRLIPQARGRKVKAQRAEVGLFLRQLPRVRLVHAVGVHNFFDVKLVRITPGAGLDKTNLYGAFKGVEDETAAWIGVDDRDPCITFRCLQQRCRVKRGASSCFVRIEIRDLEPGGEVRKVLGDAPAELGEEAEQNPPPLPPRGVKRAPPRLVQPHLPVRTAWKVVPWAPDEIEELPDLGGVCTPPAAIRVELPAGWHPKTLRGLAIEPGMAPTLTLHRTEYTHPEAGLIWLYREAPPALAAHEQRTARG